MPFLLSTVCIFRVGRRAHRAPYIQFFSKGWTDFATAESWRCLNEGCIESMFQVRGLSRSHRDSAAATLWNRVRNSSIFSARTVVPPLVRTTAGRDPSVELEASKNCKPFKLYKQQRKTWNHYSSDGNQTAVNESYWEKDMPDNMCADLPRTTAGMLVKGYYDIPAIARRPVLCTYGTPPNLPPRRKEDMCNDYAYYDVNKGRCVCKGMDAKERDPEKYADYPWGTVCVECETSSEERSIVFILDGSGTVERIGWRQQKLFMEQVVKHLKSVRVGVVVVADISFVAFEMDSYEKIKDNFT
ncbi:hypothetical protein Y032_0116g555 [Ancylostoma ceylanicum]|uniref:VWFA domain-containing protein n=2 Tax=Ancylostoma ceylanicum TaxID=53326 RepID=A0A016TCF2_9BILA|nr:hypothetical protein Y032_0116g555 [Ancylostoma ceylanicum]